MTDESRAAASAEGAGAHLDLDILRRFGRGALERRRGFEVAVHLFSCPACRELLPRLGSDRAAVEAAFRSLFPGGTLADAPSEEGGTGPGARDAAPEAEPDEELEGEYEESFRKLRRMTADLMPRLERLDRERREAPGRLAELDEAPATRWEWMVRNEPRFQTYGLAEHLLAECRRHWSDDAARGQALAELAVIVIGTLHPEEHLPEALADLEAEAWGCVANCLRIRSDVRRVEEIFELAEELRRLGGGDPVEEGVLLDLRGSYLIDQRRFKAAEKVLKKAVGLFRRAKDRHREGRAMIGLARLYRERGEASRAIEALERARRLVNLRVEARSRLGLEQNLAVCLREAGRLDEAREAVALAHDLADELGSRLDKLRVLWTEGLIRHEAKELDRATETLKLVQRGFLEEGLPYDAALASLDLAAVVLDSGDSQQARRLAQELVPLFTARGIHREAAAALGLLQRALHAATADLDLVREIAAYLERARKNPILRFRRLG